MKKVISIFILLFMLLVVKASATYRTDTLPGIDSSKIAAALFKKAKTQTTIGRAMIGTGTVMALVGLKKALSSLRIFPANSNNEPDKNQKLLAGIFDIGGLLLLFASLPVFGSAWENKKKARLFLKGNTPVMPGAGIPFKNELSGGVVINF